MVQLFRVTLNGNNITEKIDNASIPEQMQRIYNTASFISDDNLVTKGIIKIELGDKIFEGFIFSSTKTGDNKYNIQCRTVGGYLTTPFIASDTELVIPVKTSHALCAYYSDKYGIPIIITSINLNFGGDYVQKGTPLSALVSVANTTGADYWFDGTSIRIEPAKWIEEQGEEIPKTDIFDYEPFAKTIDQRGVGTVIVGTKSTSTDKTVSMSCNSKINGCDGNVMIRVIPHDSYQSSEGLTGVISVQTPLSYKGVISNSSYLSLEADIKSIKSIKIDNAVVSGYTTIANTVVFTTEKRGVILVEYVGYGYTATANTKMVGGDKVASFSVYYGECEEYNYDGILTCPGGDNPSDKTVGGNCGGVITQMPKTMNYKKGFTFSTFGVVPYIYFLDKSNRINISVSSNNKIISIIEPATLSTYNETESVRHKLKIPMSSVLGVKAKGKAISYTSDYEYVYLSSMADAVTVAYEATGMEHTVSGTNSVFEDVSMVVAGEDGGQCDYSLAGEDLNDPGTLTCSLGDSVLISIVDIHGISLEVVRGKSIPITDPFGTIITHVADDFGAVTIDNIQNGTYRIDTDSCWANSYIKFISYAI